MNIDYLLTVNKKHRTVIFDLDNTIYKETDFLFKAYSYLSSNIYGSRAEEAYCYLCSNFLISGRYMLFNNLIKHMNYPNVKVDDCLYYLRNFKQPNKIMTYPWFREYIKKTPSNLPVNIITNGNITQQKNKIESLNFDSINISVIYANKYKPKPNIDSYNFFKANFKCNQPVYVGDSEIDKQFALNCNIEFFNVNNII